VQTLEVLREVETLCAEKLYDEASALAIDPAHLGEGRAERAGRDELGGAVAREACDVGGEISHALERCAHSDRRDDDAEVTRDRLLTRKDLDGELIELVRGRIDVSIRVDDGVRGVALAVA